jgi:type I restriction enzyme, S subunit
MTPKGWEVARLGEVGEWLSGGTPSKRRSEFWSGSIPWVSPKDMKVARIGDAEDHVSAEAAADGSRLVPPGTLLLVVRGMILAHTVPVAVTTRQAAFNQDIKALLPHRGITADFLLYWLQNREQSLLNLVDTATHGTKRLPSESLFAVRVPHPPLPEQRKIAAILSSVDEAIEKTQAVIDQVQVVKKGLMRELLTRGLPGRHKKFKKTAIGEIPEEWAARSVQEIASQKSYACVGGPFGSDLTAKAYTQTGVPVIRGGNLNASDRWMREDGFVYVSDDKADALVRNLAYPGDIIFTQRGTLGQVARIRPGTGHQRFLLSQSQMKLTVDEGIANPDFVVFFFQSDAAISMIQRATIATGIPHINLSILRSFLLPVPPLAEQAEIVAALDAVEHRITAESCWLAHLQATKSALMSVLLTGEVRVKPDPEAA